MNLEIEALDDLEAPLSDSEGVGLTLIALGCGLLVGAGIVVLT